MKVFLLLLFLLVGCGIDEKDISICKDTCAFFNTEFTVATHNVIDGGVNCHCRIKNKHVWPIEIPRAIQDNYHITQDGGRTE